MLALVSSILLAGYTLVYAAVANGGALAGKPWESWRIDAYDVSQKPQGGTIAHAGTNILKLLESTNPSEAVAGWIVKLVKR